MGSSSILSTLEHVSNIKLAKLDKRRNEYQAEKRELVERAMQAPTPSKRAMILISDAKERHTPAETLPLPTKNMDIFMKLAEHDNSVSPEMVELWSNAVVRSLDHQGARFESTALFSALVQQWIKNPNDNLSSTSTKSKRSNSGSDTETFEPVGRVEMQLQRQQWEEYAFNVKETDTDAIGTFLDDVFETASQAKGSGLSPLEKLRSAISDFKLMFMNKDDVTAAIKTILRADLFAGEQRKAFEDLLSMPNLLSEIADVLSTDIESIGSWNWEKLPMCLKMRRQLNGKYRVYLNEEIYQAILIQYIGMQWAVFLKDHFKKFSRSAAWLEPVSEKMGRKHAERRKYFLRQGNRTTSDNLRQKRRDQFLKEFFMTQLPDDFDNCSAGYDEEPQDNTGNTPVQTKQNILRSISADCLIDMRLYGEFTVLQSDFKWFGPSLPHSTLFKVLRYLRFPEIWINFFHKFLTPSLFFDQDGKNAISRRRARGMHMSHTLSDALCEVTLFVLDVAVNQRTEGSVLYRFHDDLWAWGSSDTCQKAWRAINEFTNVMGLELNQEKTGSAVVRDAARAKGSPPKGLPKGKVSWGFLRFQAETGRWIIDQDLVDEQITEFRRQLASCRSVLAHVQCYNAYVRFLLNNFGRPAYCLGRPHLEEVQRTIARIHKAVYPETGGNVAAHIRNEIKKSLGDEFNSDSVPDGFFFFPSALGGLELTNPLIDLQLKSESASDDEPGQVVDKALKDDRAKYEDYRASFEEDDQTRVRPESVSPDETFISMDEYMLFREILSTEVSRAWSTLLGDLNSEDVSRSPALRVPVINSNYKRSNSPQMSAIFELYGPEVMRECGDLRLGEKEYLPLGLLETLRSEKFRWQG